MNGYSKLIIGAIITLAVGIVLGFTAWAATSIVENAQENSKVCVRVDNHDKALVYMSDKLDHLITTTTKIDKQLEVLSTLTKEDRDRDKAREDRYPYPSGGNRQ